MTSENKISNGVEEIEMLRKRIAELEAVSGREKEAVVKEVLKEHIENPAEQVLAEKPKMASGEIGERAERLTNIAVAHEEDPHQRQILELLQFVQDKGVLNAMAIVKRMNDPHLEDDFHAALINYFKNA
jgi:hypothetical protein